MKELKLSAEETKKIDSIIDVLVHQCNFNSLLINELYRGEWTNAYEEILEANGLYFNSGASKVVVLHDDLDWVIKAPIRTFGERWVGRIQTDNFCYAEAQVYKLAVESDLSCYFAPCFYYKTEGGIPFYVQLKMDCNEDELSDGVWKQVSSSYSRENYKDDDEYYEAVNEEFDNLWDDDVLYYIFDSSDLVDFVHENELNDFHYGNFGYNKDGNPVLVDYSGY